ncbi:hypothetical protein IKF33_02525 [Candidatus Saccharibacteria bacterium]|nr:hypothetical protein [Candidatus Saccharibacteria bacterium]
MATIVPTILTADTNEYRSLVESFATFTRRVQIDISDGIFAQPATIPEFSAWWPKEWEVDIHMMVAKPSEHLPALLKLKPSLVIFHAEVEEDLIPIMEQLRNAGIKVGVALLKSTYPGRVKETINAADHVLIFAGDLGRQGGEADMLQIEKVPIIRSINKNVEIGWDGGVNLSNIRAIAHSDIDVINVGKAITQSTERPAIYKALVAEADKRGVVLN